MTVLHHDKEFAVKYSKQKEHDVCIQEELHQRGKSLVLITCNKKAKNIIFLENSSNEALEVKGDQNAYSVHKIKTRSEIV